MSALKGDASNSFNPRDFAEIDIDHLMQYTLGDADLQNELLGLFKVQLEGQCLELDGCQTAQDWKRATHTLKGAARAIGAMRIGEIAERLEALSCNTDDARRELEQLARARAAFEAELARLTG